MIKKNFDSGMILRDILNLYIQTGSGYDQNIRIRPNPKPCRTIWVIFGNLYSILKILKGLSEFCDELFLLVCENWIQIDSPYLKWKSWNVLNQSSPGDRGRLNNTKAAATLLIWSFVPHYIICPRVCWTKSVCTAVLSFSFNPSLFWILAQALLNSCGYHR